VSANLAHDLFRSADRHPQSSAAITDSRHYTYAELADYVVGVACGLAAHDVNSSDRVVYQVSNGPSATVLFYAILALGAVAVPASPLLSRRETDEIRRRTSAVLSIGERSDFDHEVICAAGEVDSLPTGDGGVGYEVSDRDPDDPAVIFFTSGTTGTPKGVVLSHRNLSSNAQWAAECLLSPDAIGTDDCVAAVLPLSHSFALTCCQNAPIRAGASITYASRFDGPDLLDQFRRDAVTISALVPSAARALLEASREDPEPAQLRYCLIGGAPTQKALVYEFESALRAVVLEGYGLTETSPVCASRTPSVARKAGSVGRAAGFAELAVLTSGVVNDAGEGELLVRGPGVFTGYLDPSTDEKACYQDGWFRTGDIARIDEEGDVFILDRAKDLIIRNGYNISPVEVENTLAGNPAVRDVGVVGVPDDRVGEEVVAFVVPQAEAASTSDIMSRCREELARYKWPGRVEVIDAIPRGAKGQVLRDRLRAES
jgi:long-chain acyl-CoA synthetase